MNSGAEPGFVAALGDWRDAAGPAYHRLVRAVRSQAAALRFFRDAERIRALRLREIAERRARLFRELERQLPSWTYTRPAGGPSVWVRRPHGSAVEFAPVASRRGVSVVTGDVFSPGGRFTDHVRLPFMLESETIQEGVDRLARPWSAYAPSTRPEGPCLRVLA